MPQITQKNVEQIAPSIETQDVVTKRKHGFSTYEAKQAHWMIKVDVKLSQGHEIIHVD